MPSGSPVAANHRSSARATSQRAPEPSAPPNSTSSNARPLAGSTLKKPLDGVRNLRNVVRRHAGPERQAQASGGQLFGNGERPRRQPGRGVGLLTVGGHRVVDERTDPGGRQVLLQRVAPDAVTGRTRSPIPVSAV